ncbi:MAG: fibronectin type III domain-containing protein [candidate division Zixibacteria bacterium]|nr:fibronectin type III domain-containing protein [candidate division Zixibacteria bacterium]
MPNPAGQVLAIDGFAYNAAPVISLDSIGGIGTFHELHWFDQDPDNDARISLYYDDDSKGFDGVLINATPISENDAANSYGWDHSSLPPGTYYVYGIIADSSNAAQAVYAPGKIVVDAVGGPATPTGLLGEATDSSVILSWSAVPEPRCGFLIHYTSDIGSNSWDRTAAVDDTTWTELLALTPGRTYKFAVSAYDTLGVQGPRSNPIIVQYVSHSLNNPPLITSIKPPLTAINGNMWNYLLSAIDGDSDPITFSIDSCPSGVSLSGTMISWTPDLVQTGPQQFHILASDGRGGYDTLRFTVQVRDAESSRGIARIHKGEYRGYHDTLLLFVDDADQDVSDTTRETVTAVVRSSSDATGISLTLLEASVHSSTFVAVFTTTSASSNSPLRQLHVAPGDTITVSYLDAHPAQTATAQTVWRSSACCPVTTGNVDCDPAHGVDISDLSALIDHLFINFTPLCCKVTANVDGSVDGSIDISDLSALIDYLYINFTPPALCQ